MEATSPLAIAARAKFGSMIEAGRQQSHDFFTRMGEELPTDYIVKTDKLGFEVQGNQLMVNATADDGQPLSWSLHRNALSQMVTKTDILTTRVADKMFDASGETLSKEVDHWGRQLLVHNLSTIYEKTDRARVLIRVVRTPQMRQQGLPGQIRAFVSDRYLRLNSGPILQAFAEKAIQFGAVPLVNDRRFRTTYYEDVKVGFGMYLPMVFEPVQGEVIMLGMMIESSDFGVGSLTVRLTMMRITCTNLQIMRDELRKVHLGGRLPDTIQFSEETYKSDTQTMCLAVQDMVGNLLNPVRINQQIATIQAAAEEQVNPKAIYEALRKSGHLLKAEAKGATELFNEPDVEMMPQGNTLWRANQALSLFANKMEEDGNSTRANELRHVAGRMLDKFEADKAAEAKKAREAAEA